MPYAKRFNHPWNKQWYDSPFMRYLTDYRKKRNYGSLGALKLLCMYEALNRIANERLLSYEKDGYRKSY